MGKIRKIGDEVLKELETVAPRLAAIAKVNPFLLPEGYFDTLDAELSKSLGHQTPNRLPTDDPFKVPLGYFDELPERIIDQVSGEEPELGEVLEAGKSLQPFQVPAAYFDQLPERILQAAKQQSPAKVISLWPRLRIVAAGAAIVSAVVLTFSLYNNRVPEPAPPTSEITPQEINEYLLANVDDFSEAQIAQFVGEEKLNTITLEDSYDLTDSEIEDYLLDEIELYELEEGLL